MPPWWFTTGTTTAVVYYWDYYSNRVVLKNSALGLNFTTGITTTVVVPVVNQHGGIEKFSPRAEFSIP